VRPLGDGAGASCRWKKREVGSEATIRKRSSICLQTFGPPEAYETFGIGFPSTFGGSEYLSLEVSMQAPVRPSDPDDEIFLLCAIDGQADYLVTDDNDLLSLRSNYAALTIGCCSELSIPLGA